MIDPDNPKDSILEDLQWAEREVTEFLRETVLKHVKAMTFAPYDMSAQAKRIVQSLPIRQDDPRKIVLVAIMHCPGSTQPEVFSAIQKSLKGQRISMTFDNQRSNEETMVVTFEAPRWKPLE